MLEYVYILHIRLTMNKATALLNELMAHYKVGTLQELAEKLDVARNTISGWKSRDAVNSIAKKIYELDLPIDTLQYVNEVTGNATGIHNGNTYHRKAEDKSSYQEKFDKLLMIAKGTDNLDILEECLRECRRKILEVS